MPGLNQVTIIGHLGKDPEMAFTPSGAAVTKFSVAVGRKWNTADGEQKEETEWFNVVCWNKLAETTNQYLAKGRLVYVSGRQHTNTWESQDGVKHYRTELVASQVLFLSAKTEQSGDALPNEADDIPFNDNKPPDGF